MNRPDWCPLLYIYSAVQRPGSPDYLALADHEAAIVAALRSGSVPVRAIPLNGMAFERVERYLGDAEILVLLSWIEVRTTAGAPKRYGNIEADRTALLDWLVVNELDRRVPEPIAQDGDEAHQARRAMTAEASMRLCLQQQPAMPIQKKQDVWNRRCELIGDELGDALSRRALDRAWRCTPSSWQSPGHR